MSYLAIDCGTSACRSAVVTEDGRIVALARRPVRVHRPGPLYAEMDPDEIWAAVLSTIRSALRQASSFRKAINAVGVSTLLGYVFLDGNHRPLGRSLIWMDNRAGVEADEIRRCIPERTVFQRTGRRISPELLAPKLMWFKQNKPSIYRRIRTVIGLKDEMVRRLSGTVQTDFAHLDYSLLFDVRKSRMDTHMASELGIDPALFPQPLRATEVAGGLAPDVARCIGLPAGLPVVCGSSDGTTAMYGGGVLLENSAVLVTGTTDVLMTASSGWVKDRSQSLTVNTGMVPGIFLAGGAMGFSGGTIRYLKKLMRLRLQPLVEKIRRLPPGSEGLLMLPGLTGERSPLWMEYVSGGLAGLTPGHGPEHVFRAAMEGAALRTVLLLNRLKACGLTPFKMHVAGGGADFDVWNRIRADASGLEVVKLMATEATVIGTAMFCRAAIDPGVSLREISRQWIRFSCSYPPDPPRVKAYREIAGLFDEYLHSMGDVSKKLSQRKVQLGS